MPEKGQKSQDLYLDILNIKKDYRGVRNYAQELLKLNFEPAREVQNAQALRDGLLPRSSKHGRRSTTSKALGRIPSLSPSRIRIPS